MNNYHMGIKELDMSSSSIPMFINKKVTRQVVVPAVIKTSTLKEINHKDIDYKGKKYTICYTTKNKVQPILFVIDTEDKEKIINQEWFSKGEFYIGRETELDGVRKIQYLHNVIMDKYQYNEKGQEFTVDHINRIGRDNRKINLQIKSQSEQNQNQKQRDRDELPEEFGIKIQNVPKNIYHVKANGKHGSHFELCISGVPEICENGKKNYYYRGSRGQDDSKDGIKKKYIEIIEHLKDLREKHPIVKKIIKICKEDDEERIEKVKEFNNIIKLSGYPKDIINKNLVDIEYEYTELLFQNDTQAIKEVRKYMKNKENGIKKDKPLPTNCGITMDMIKRPYVQVYYVDETIPESIYFVIERKNKGFKKISYSTTRSTKVSIQDKLKELNQKYDELITNGKMEKIEEPKKDTIDIPIKMEEIIKGGNTPKEPYRASEETKQKLSEAKKGDKNPNKNGLSEEHANNIRLSTLGSHGCFKGHEELIDTIREQLKIDYPSAKTATKTLRQIADEYTKTYLKPLKIETNLNKDILSDIMKGYIINITNSTPEEIKECLRLRDLREENKKARGGKPERVLSDEEIFMMRYAKENLDFKPAVLHRYFTVKWDKGDNLSINIVNTVCQGKTVEYFPIDEERKKELIKQVIEYKDELNNIALQIKAELSKQLSEKKLAKNKTK